MVFLHSKKRDLLYHHSRGMRLGGRKRYEYDRGNIVDRLLNYKLRQQLSLAKEALSSKRVASTLRRMRQFARRNEPPASAEQRRLNRIRRESDNLMLRQNEAIRQYWRGAAARGAQQLVELAGGGIVPALQSAWRNRHTRTVPTQDPEYVRNYYQ